MNESPKRQTLDTRAIEAIADDVRWHIELRLDGYEVANSAHAIALVCIMAAQAAQRRDGPTTKALDVARDCADVEARMRKAEAKGD